MLVVANDRSSAVGRGRHHALRELERHCPDIGPGGHRSDEQNWRSSRQFSVQQSLVAEKQSERQRDVDIWRAGRQR